MTKVEMSRQIQPRLDQLLLTEKELELARNRVRELAYHKWQESGCPEGDELSFWQEAECEWIEYYYVPNR